MCKFIQIKALDSCYNKDIKKHLGKLSKIYQLYCKYLEDDFTHYNSVLELINSLIPNFWIICDMQENFMGFVYLDNFTGNDKQLYCTEITCCFDKIAWGSFTKYCAKIFLKYCFDKFELTKIKAQIYPENHKVKTLLKKCGFSYETTIPNETLRNNKMQDIDVYSIYRNYYYN